MIEHGLDVVESIVVCNGIGGNMIPLGCGGSCAQLLADNVGLGKVKLERIPC